MEVAIIAPIALLEECCITRTQYCLPRLLKSSRKYQDFYAKRASKGDFIILDSCKPGWKREPENIDLVLEATELMNPSIIVLPSYTYNLEKTIEVAGVFLKALSKYLPRLIACLEGTNKEEVFSCMSRLKSTKYALPSYLIGTLSSKKIHLYLDNKVSIEELDKKPGMLATSLPVRLGLRGKLLSDCKPYPPSLTFYETENKYPELLKRNIEETIEFYNE